MKKFIRFFKAFKKRLPALLLLNAGMLVIIFSMYLICGDSFFSIYVKKMALNIMSVSDFIIYILILAVYGFTVEFILRSLVQNRLLKSEKAYAKIAGVAAPIIVYVLIHLQFGLPGIVIAAVSGLFLSLFYLKNKDWITFSIWHAMLPLILIPLSMVVCVFIDGQVRQDFLFAYKKRHITKEKMYYVDNWGWVDYTHYRPEHYKHIEEAFAQESEKGQTVLKDRWITPLKIQVDFNVKYTFEKQTDPMKRWAQITGILMHFMRINEEVQESSPWYHGNQLSAWQFDDMSSCLLCCLDHLPDKSYFIRGEPIHDQESLLAIWEKNGEEMVSLKMKEENSWGLIEDEAKRKMLMNLVDQMKSTWQVEKGPAAAGFK